MFQYSNRPPSSEWSNAELMPAPSFAARSAVLCIRPTPMNILSAARACPARTSRETARIAVTRRFMSGCSRCRRGPHGGTKAPDARQRAARCQRRERTADRAQPPLQLNVAVKRSAHDVPVQSPPGLEAGPRSLSLAEQWLYDAAAPTPHSSLPHHSLPAAASMAKPRFEVPFSWSVPLNWPEPNEAET